MCRRVYPFWVIRYRKAYPSGINFTSIKNAAREVYNGSKKTMRKKAPPVVAGLPRNKNINLALISLSKATRNIVNNLKGVLSKVTLRDNLMTRKVQRGKSSVFMPRLFTHKTSLTAPENRLNAMAHLYSFKRSPVITAQIKSRSGFT